MFNLSYTILTRNLVHGLQFKKKKITKNKLQSVSSLPLQMYKKNPPSNAADGSRTLRNIPLVCLRKVTHIAL